MKNVEHIFFDLDHTLWDFERNSTEAIFELFEQHQLQLQVASFEKFIADYQQINFLYWDRYNRQEIDKETVRYGRFVELFKKYQIQNHTSFAYDFADQYIEIAPLKTHLFPDTHEVLQYLQTKYQLHLISNGFKEVMQLKLERTELTGYFNLVLSAEDVGVNKPHPLVFQTALEKTKARAETSLMIGDSYEADILGAKKVGMHTIHFNPNMLKENSESVEIHRLRQLFDLL